MEIKWTITLGEAIQIMVFLVGVVSVYVKMNDKLTRMETKVNLLYAWWCRQMKAYSSDADRLMEEGN
jgi:hypothetical protein